MHICPVELGFVLHAWTSLTALGSLLGQGRYVRWPGRLLALERGKVAQTPRDQTWRDPDCRQGQSDPVVSRCRAGTLHGRRHGEVR